MKRFKAEHRLSDFFDALVVFLDDIIQMFDLKHIDETPKKSEEK
ncbi:MAG: hypothetical protein ACJAUP_002554 [Cellvibrionaceae bacterium]|jgi:hypothetical protein